MSSILTNQSAIVALQTLKSVNANLGKAQSEISTGKTVANAKDNAAVWAISKVMETDASAFKTMQKNLNVAEATISTARMGAEQIADMLREVKNLAIGATVSTADFDKINTDILRKFEQIASVLGGTQMNGVNLLSGTTTTSLDVTASLDRENGTVATTANTISVSNQALDTSLGLDATSPSTAPTGYTDITDTASALTAIGVIEQMIDDTVVAAAELGSYGKRVSDQSAFVGKLADSLNIGMGSLIDADMEEASARLQALQTQQQLGIQSLSIANQAPSAILSLFR